MNSCLRRTIDGGAARALGVLMAAVLLADVNAVERQVTHAPYGHVLTNINVWSPDGRWVVYDVRSLDSVFDGTRIEQVNAETGEIQTLYRTKNGAAAGVVTYHPHEPKVVFIHGPENPTPEWNYGASRRHGALVDVRQAGVARSLDALNYAPPFTPGALRGGSHVHVYSPDGAWVSFTYEDEVLARLGATGNHDLNQRTIGVSVPLPAGRQVVVDSAHPRNHNGDAFTVIVARTSNRPRPGSDEISRAYEEGWVNGHAALAFLGNVTAADGREHAEVFIVDLPADLTVPGDEPLQGTATRRPAPPRGVTQRRLTFTADRPYRGVASAPRHWVRASPDGRRLAFLMKDDAGVVQFWTIAPEGGRPRQVTRGATGITSAFTWSPDGQWIAHTSDGSVCITEAETGVTRRLTPRRMEFGPEALACVFSPDGRMIAFTRPVTAPEGTFSQVFTVTTGIP